MPSESRSAFVRGTLSTRRTKLHAFGYLVAPIMVFGMGMLHAAEHRFEALLDLDRSASTGCVIAGVSGIERVIRVNVNSSTSAATVSTIERLDCVGGALGAPTSLPGAPYPLNVATLPNATAVELAVPLASLPSNPNPGEPTIIRIAAASRAGDGSTDVLAPPVDFQLRSASVVTNGPSGIPVHFTSYYQTILLALFLLGLGSFSVSKLSAHGKTVARRAAGSLVIALLTFSGGATLIYAIVLDGRTDDWSGTPPLIVGAVGDRPVNADMTALFAKVENEQLAIRIDARLALEPIVANNQPPTIAGLADLAITLPEHRVQLTPVVADDGLPTPAALSYQWRMLSGPRAVVFGDTLSTAPIIFSAAQASAAQTSSRRNTVAFFDATRPGVYTLRLTVSDGALSSSRDVQVVVNEAVRVAPSLGPLPDRQVRLADTLSVSLAGRDSDPRAQLSYALDIAPNGAALVPSGSARLQFTPNAAQVGSHPVTLRVTDNDGQSATASFNIVVLPQNRAPSLAAPPNASVAVGATFAYTLQASDPDGDSPLLFELASAPLGMSLSGSNLRWTPTAAQLGLHTVVVGVRDPGGRAAVQSFNIRVGSNAAPSARDDRYEVLAGATLNVNAASGVLANDIDPESDVLRATKLSDPDRGSISAFAADGSFTYQAPSIAPAPDLGWELRMLLPNVGSLGAAELVGDVNGDGYPDILQHNLNADLRAFSGRDGSQIFALDQSQDADCSRWLFAVQHRVWADLDDSGKLTYAMSVLCGRDPAGTAADRVLAFNELGQVKWLSPPLSLPHPDKRVGTTPVPEGGFTVGGLAYQRGLSAARLTANGRPVLLLRGELAQNDGNTAYVDANNVTRYAGCRAVTGLAIDEGRACRYTLIIDGANGRVLQRLVAPNPTNSTIGVGLMSMRELPPIAYDVNGDGRVDLVSGSEVFVQNASGGFDLAWQIEQPVNDTAVADLDGDGRPEIIQLRASPGATSPDGGVFVYDAAGSLRVRIPIQGYWMTPLSIADVDGDGKSDIVVGANGILFALRHDGQVIWTHLVGTDTPTDPIFGPYWRDTLEASRLEPTPPQVYDLDGNGINEVIFAVDGRLLVLDGRTGRRALPPRWTFNRAGGDTLGAIRLIDFDNNGEVEIFAGGNIAFNCLFVGFPAGACNTIIGPVMKSTSGTSWKPGPKVYPQLQFRDGSFTDSGRVLHNTEVSGLFRNAKQRGTIADAARAFGTSFTYAASDSADASDSAVVNILIHPQNRPPQFTSVPPVSFHQRNQEPASLGPVRHTYQPSAIDPDVGDSVSYAIKTGPSWVYMQQPSGLMTFAPPCGTCDVGWITVVISATDTRGASTDQLILVNLTNEAVNVPNVLGQSTASALASLQNAGLAGVVVDALPSTAPAGHVIGQVPSAGSSTGRADSIRLTVSSGPASVIVPNVIGLDEGAARSRLDALGFTVQVSYTFSAAIDRRSVMQQSLAAGSLQPPQAISLVVSAGSGLRLHLNRDVMRADSSITARPEALNVNGEVIGNPAVSYAITPVQPDFSGPLPVIQNNVITAQATTRGVFRVVATDSSNKTAAREFIVLPTTSVVWEEVITRLIEIEDLAPQIQTAIANADVPTQRTLLETIIAIWIRPLPDGTRLPDRWPNASLLQLDRGFAPSACEQRAFSRNPTLADLLQQARNQRLNDRIRNLIAQLQDPNGLRRDLEIELDALRDAILSVKDLGSLNDAASGLSEIESLQWAASRGVGEVVNGLMDQAQAVLGGAQNKKRGARFEKTNFAELTVTTTLQGIVSAIGEQTYGPIRQTVYRGLRQAAFSAAAMQANNWLRETLKGKAIEGVATGASSSFHTFGLPNSFIEVPGCLGDARNYTVLFIGPDLLESMIELIEKIKEGVSFDRNELFNELKWRNPFGRDLIRDDISNRLREIRSAVNGVADAVIAAWQGPNDTDFGCIFGTGPACQQLIFDEGIAPVYTLQYGQNPPFPAAVLTIVFDNAFGDVFIGTPLFFPLRKGLFD